MLVRTEVFGYDAVIRWVFPIVTKEQCLKDIGNQSPSDTASYPRRHESLHSLLSHREVVRKNTLLLVIVEVFHYNDYEDCSLWDVIPCGVSDIRWHRQIHAGDGSSRSLRNVSTHLPMYMVSYPKTVISFYHFVTDADLHLHMSYVFVSVSHKVHTQVI